MLQTLLISNSKHSALFGNKKFLVNSQFGQISAIKNINSNE